MTDHSPDRPLLIWGVESGLASGLAVAGYYFVIDLAHLAPLATPVALIGAFLGLGSTQSAGEPLRGAMAFAASLGDVHALALLVIFSLLHILVFTLLGMAAVWAFRSAAWPLNPVTGALYGLTVCSAVFYISLALAGHAAAAIGIPGLVSVLVANTLAGAAIGGGVQLMEKRRPAGC